MCYNKYNCIYKSIKSYLVLRKIFQILTDNLNLGQRSHSYKHKVSFL